MRVVSGIQPTGPLHLGNYLGAVRQWINLQEQKDADCLFFIADYHSLTENFDPKVKHEQIYELAAELLALGINPKKCTLFVQSDVPEVTELAWIFNTLVSTAELSRMTQFKDKSNRQTTNINMGLFDYPVLQAADIIIYDGESVPVGADQVQHIELARDVAREFNRRFGKTFSEPKPLLTKSARVMSLLDPMKKMSKSLGEGHFMSLSDEPETTQKKLARAVTDTVPGENMSPGVKNLFALLEFFGEKKDSEKFKKDYNAGTIKYSELKVVLGDRLSNYFSAFRSKRKKYLSDKSKIEKILVAGANKAKKLAEAKMKEVRKKIGLIH